MGKPTQLLLLLGGAGPARTTLAESIRARVMTDMSGAVHAHESLDALISDVAHRCSPGTPCVVVLDPDVQSPMNAARRIAKTVPDATFIVVAAAGEEARLRHEAIYASPAGGRLTVLSGESPVFEQQVRAAVAAAEQQQRFRTTLDKMKFKLANPGPVDPAEYRRLVVSDQYLANVLQHAHDAIVSVDPQGRVMSWNDGAQQLFGLPAAHAVGTRFSTMFRDPAVAQGFADAALAGGVRAGGLEVGEVDVRYVDANFSAIDGGSSMGIVAILRDVTERHHAEEELRASSRQKDEFLAMLAHELRNPLAPIRNAAQILQLLQSDDDRVQAATAVIKRQSDHLSALLDDLLDVARVTRGAVALDRQSIPVEEILADAVEQARTLIEARHHELSVVRRLYGVHVLGDRKRLVQVLTNLLVNAAKYTPDGGRITITIDADDSVVKTTVDDTGIGIDAALLGSVFNLFVQQEQSLDRAHGGLGIGLALAKSLVTMHGGAISASSAGRGKGSSFMVSLPRAQPPTIAQIDSPTMPTEGDIPARLTLMVVDDNADAAQTLGILLETEGYEVEVATDSRVALEHATRRPADVFILDIGMPELDGYELAKRIRSLQGAHPPLLVALTGYGSEADQERARSAGFDYHFTKPVDAAALSKLLRQEAKRLLH